MTKAERIYKDTRYECRKHIEYWGLGKDDNEKPIGFTGVMTRDDESVSKRTINALRQLLKADRKHIRNLLTMGIINGEEYTSRMETATMVEATIENEERSL